MSFAAPSHAEADEASLFVGVHGAAGIAGNPLGGATTFSPVPGLGVGAGMTYGFSDSLRLRLAVDVHALLFVSTPAVTATIPGDTTGQILAGTLQSHAFVVGFPLRVEYAFDLSLSIADIAISDLYVAVGGGPSVAYFVPQALHAPDDPGLVYLVAEQLEPSLGFGGAGTIAVGYETRFIDALSIDVELAATAGFVGAPVAFLSLTLRPSFAFYPFSAF